MNRDTFEVQSEQEGERLDKYLSSIYPDISRSFFQRILKENQILVNDKPQKANYRLKTDDIVDVTIPDAYRHLFCHRTFLLTYSTRMMTYW